MNENADCVLRYFGTDIIPEPGDHVRYVDHPENLIVENVIDSPENKNEWGLTEFGVMMRGEKYGLVFDPLDNPEIEFISRKK